MLPWLHQIAAQLATALLLTGLLFDIIGLFRKMERLLFVGFWNNLLGAAAAGAAIATGVLAQFGLGPHSELGDAWLRFHRFTAYVVVICALGIMIARIAMKGGVRPNARVFYLAAGFFTAVLVLATGAIGSTLVHSYGLGIDRETAQRVINASPAMAPPPRPSASKTP